MKHLAIINTVLGSFAFILFAAITAYYSNLDMESAQFRFFDITPFILISALCGAGMLLITYAVALNAFSHLHNKNICDMHLSLPLNHTSRFSMSFAAGLTAIAVPYAFTATIAVLVLRIFGNTELMNEQFNHIGINGFFGAVTQYLLPFILTGMLVFMFIYTLTVFCCTICGKTFMTAFYPFLISGLIPLTIIAMSVISIHNTRGMSGAGDSFMEYPMIITSPMGYLIGNINYFFSNNGDLMIETAIYTVPVILIIIGLIAASFFISRRVKAENIGRDLLFRLVYSIQQFWICFCITSLFVALLLDSNDMGAIVVWMFIITGLVFFVGDIIHHRGTKGLKKAAVKYAATMMATFLICTAVGASNGFGRGNYVPPADEIVNISLYYSIHAFYDGYYIPHKVFSFTPSHFTDGGSYYSKYQNKLSEDTWNEIVTQAREIHQATINAAGDNSFYLWIEYGLKNGTKVTRVYHNADLDTLIRKGVLKYVEIERHDHYYDCDEWYCYC
jgi:hypothetical protein